MKLVLLSPPSADPREIPLLGRFFAAGLERYHVRKPDWTLPQLEAWLASLPKAWKSRLVLHQHHGLVDQLGLLGRHWPDQPSTPADPGKGFTSRSCHDETVLRSSMGMYTSVFFGPVFASVSKPGHGPAPVPDLSFPKKGTVILALGGVRPSNLPICRKRGFDGAAVLGYVWNSQDPAAAFDQLHSETEGGRRSAA